MRRLFAPIAPVAPLETDRSLDRGAADLRCARERRRLRHPMDVDSGDQEGVVPRVDPALLRGTDHETFVRPTGRLRAGMTQILLHFEL